MKIINNGWDARFRRKVMPAMVCMALPTMVFSQALEEVVVTAQKREQSLQETPIAVTAFGAEQLESKGINDLSDLGSFAPNVLVSPMPTNTAKATIAVRGSITSNPAVTWEPTVGLYLDGIYVGKFSGNVLNIPDLERVEVLRGPQGTLYGKIL